MQGCMAPAKLLKKYVRGEGSRGHDSILRNAYTKVPVSVALHVALHPVYDSIISRSQLQLTTVISITTKQGHQLDVGFPKRCNTAIVHKTNVRFSTLQREFHWIFT